MIVISGSDSRLFTLNEVGAVIWNAANGSVSVEAIVRSVCAAFDIDSTTAARDTEAFIDALVHEGILVASAVPTPDADQSELR
jgi:hypothetical protein